MMQHEIVVEEFITSASKEQRTRFAVLCALEVCKDPAFVGWRIEAKGRQWRLE